jgi:hypothetical protein
MSLYLYNFFHLNLAYSAIEESDREKVIRQCYWPLLKLPRDLGIPIGIELSGYTLEVINDISSEWCEELSALIKEGMCELIGCGYTQVIGPMVPHQITTANLEIGNQIYQRILNTKPAIALLNEQAFSKGMVQLYKDADFQAIIMEWNNPARVNPQWGEEIGFLPQQAMGNNNSSVDLIWNKSIGFQKFQRYVHGEIELNDLLDFICENKSQNNFRAFPVYGNDVEIFDFRPGRYMTEAKFHPDGEWNRIYEFYDALKKQKDSKIVLPSKVLELREESGANKLLDLTSASQPIPVKKQGKYNVVRWAVTGRNDLDINTRCYKLYYSLVKENVAYSQEYWKELCYLWSSDFRTHITDKRWTSYIKRLKELEEKIPSFLKFDLKKTGHVESISLLSVSEKGKFVSVENDMLSIKFNKTKGLAVESFIDRNISDRPLFGTLQHGYFNDINLGADYYSGHLVFESPGKHKVTDLSLVSPAITNAGHMVEISCSMQTSLGPIYKKWTVYASGQMSLQYKLEFHAPLIGRLHTGFVTLLAENFSQETLNYTAHNGGKCPDNFFMDDEFNHSDPISFLVSSNQAVGLTKGELAIGDDHFGVKTKIDNAQLAGIGMIQYSKDKDKDKDKDKKLIRSFISYAEIDDTSKNKAFNLELEIIFSGLRWNQLKGVGVT